jgi:acyl dehydratase
MAHFQTLSQLLALVGQEVAVSEWTLITQTQVNQFDVERAKAGPFGGPIVHGFMTLSLIARFFDECLLIDEPSMGVNYGLNKVRFMAPVPVGSRVRARLKLLASEPVSGPGGSSGVQMTWEVKIELEGQDKPVCVAESLGRRYPMPS